MAAPVAAIHDLFFEQQTWMPITSPRDGPEIGSTISRPRFRSQKVRHRGNCLDQDAFPAGPAQLRSVEFDRKNRMELDAVLECNACLAMDAIEETDTRNQDRRPRHLGFE